MMYTIIIQCAVDVDAESEGDAINKACLEATFGTNLYGISLVSAEKEDGEGGKDGNV